MRVAPIHNNFTAGELTPKLGAQTELARYANGLKTCQNCLIQPQGGACKRTGFEYIAEVKNSASGVRLIPFIFSETQAYVLEFGDQYMRMFMDGGQITEIGGDGIPPALHPTACCTDPDNDQDNTTGWIPASCILTSEAGGVTGNRLKIAASAANGRAEYGNFSMTAGKKYRLKAKIGSDVGDTHKVYIYSGTYAGKAYDSGYFAGAGAGNWDTIDVVFECPSTETDWRLKLQVEANGDNGYFDNVSLWELGQVPVEISTPYLESELSLIKRAQSADTLYATHPDHEQAKLTRSSHTAWTLGDISFNPPPTSVQDWINAVTLTPGQITGNAVTFVSDTAIFQTGDADRQIVFGSSRAIITAFNATTRVTADIIDDWPDLDPMPPGDWALRGSPTGSVTPDKKEPLGALITLTSAINSFRSGDVGRYVAINDGFIKITQYVGATSVKGEILKELSGIAATATWTLETTDWSAVNGYPKCVMFFDGRLFFGGSASFLSNIWGSVAGDYENHTPGADDADAINTTLVSGQVDVIQWMSGTKKLIIGTAGAEWWMSGGTGAEEIITPTNKMARAETTFGSEDRQPVNINNRIIFIQKPGKSLREFNYNFGIDAYEGKDLNAAADHLTWTYGIKEIAYQQTPNKIIWALRNDGVLLGLTFMPEHEVIGWHRQVTDGDVESIAVIPGDTEDELWAVIKRTINGSTKRYIERLKNTDWLYTYNQTVSIPVDIESGKWGENDTDDHSGEEDAAMKESAPDANQPTQAIVLGWSAGAGSTSRHLMKFSLKDLIPNAGIISATLYLYFYYKSGAHNVSAYRCLQNWEEYELTWNSRLTGTAWNTAGCAAAADAAEDDGVHDRKATAEDTTATPVLEDWVTLDITSLAQKWVDGNASEYGVLLKSDNEGGGVGQHVMFRQDDYATSGVRPYLEITYRPIGTSTSKEYRNKDEAFYVDCGLTYQERAEITAINAASPVVVTAVNSVIDGDQVFISRVEGTTELNENVYTVANATSVNCELLDEDGHDIDGRGYQAYASGGYMDKLATVISGLDHLEGETVAILADGEAQTERNVSSGQITLDAAAHYVVVGLPYTPVIETMRIEAGAADGTAQGRIKRIHEVTTRILATKNFKIGPDADHLESVSTDLEAVDTDVETPFPGGYNTEGRLYITQDEPQPMTILGLMPRMVTND